jgi:hypothetical protein
MQYGRAGPLIQNLVRQRLYSMLRLRANVNKDWRKRGETPVSIVMDEVQGIVTQADTDFAPIARSLGGKLVIATQNIDKLIGRLGEHQTKAFLDNFRSVFMLRSSDASYNWMSNRLGGTLRPVIQRAGAVIDYVSAVLSYASTALTDPEHPYAPTMRRLRRKGAGEIMSVRDQLYAQAGLNHRMTPATKHMRINAPTITGWKPGMVMTPGEIAAALAPKFYAVAQVLRGGVDRRDVIRMEPMYEFPKPEEVSDERAAAA